MACGYVKESGKADYVAFYTALIEAKGLNVPTEDPEMSEAEAELRERHGDGAVDAFIEVWSVDDLEFFEEAYQGEFRGGAEFAEQLVSDCYGMPREMPSFLEIDWEATWGNLRYDYCERDGFIFNTNW
jgi:antirestriction protein